MTIMWINLSMVFIFSFFSRYFSKPNYSDINIPRLNKLFVFLVIVTLALVSGLRNNIGDTIFYMHSYKITHYTLGDIDFSGDFGFNILQLLLQMISTDPQILVLVTATLTNILIIIILNQYSRIFELSVYVYITSGMFTTSMNGIRQYLAAAIVFTATKYILDGNFKKYALIILLASTVHKSALVLLPIYFIVRREAWSKVTYILIALSIFIVLGFNQFSEMLFATIDDTQYGHYKDFSEGGVNLLRVIVNAAPVIIAYIGRYKLKLVWPKSDYIVNLSIISMVFIIIASQNWIFARFNIYFGLYNLILISWILKVFKDNNKRLIYYGLLVSYFIYFYYEHVISLGIIYESDYLNI
jgi:transmembrane protein EpsG